MRAVVQRARRARVEALGEVTGAIERGLVAFVGSGSSAAPRKPHPHRLEETILILAS